MIAPDEPTAREWTLEGDGCDPRPRRRVAGTFAGHYSYGFEHSRFMPCPRDDWSIPSDTLALFHRQGASVRWSDSLELDEAEWPEPVLKDGHPRVFVQWQGTVEGPGHYGHMGMSSFELTVDRVLAVRLPSPDDCGVP